MKFRITAMWQLVVLIFLALLAAGSIDSYETKTTSLGLKIIVYGSTGRVGSRVVNEALSRGHKVTAVSRDPDRVRQQHENLAIVQGDILDRKSVSELVLGQDVIVVSVRGSADKSKDPEKAIHRDEQRRSAAEHFPVSLESQFGMIVFLGQVPQTDPLQFRPPRCSQQIRRLDIRQVASFAANPTLQRLWVEPLNEHVSIVIAFQEDCVQ